MSKLIIDMPMPQNCEECAVRIWDEDYGCCHCPFTGVETLSIGRQAKCPIKGILPDEHGDLIDRDALLRNEQDVCELCKWGYSGELIRKQQAIIAAERKHDESKTD